MNELIKIVTLLTKQLLQAFLTAHSHSAALATPRLSPGVLVVANDLYKMQPWSAANGLSFASAMRTANKTLPTVYAFQHTGRIRLPDKILPDRIRDPIGFNRASDYFDDA